MKNMALGILIVVFIAAFIQPLIEIANVLKDKVTLGAAILNSCRAARNNALASLDYYNGGGNMGDLNASIDEDGFRSFFAESFSETLGVDIINASTNPMRFGENARWGEISVRIDLAYNDASDFSFVFSGRGMSRITVRLETPYVFRTGLLQSMAGASEGCYNIEETRVFFVQMIN